MVEVAGSAMHPYIKERKKKKVREGEVILRLSCYDCDYTNVLSLHRNREGEQRGNEERRGDEGRRKRGGAGEREPEEGKKEEESRLKKGREQQMKHDYTPAPTRDQFGNKPEALEIHQMKVPLQWHQQCDSTEALWEEFHVHRLQQQSVLGPSEEWSEEGEWQKGFFPR